MAILRVRDPAGLAGAPFTYPEVGATRSEELPPGYAHTRRSAVVGRGEAALERAAAALFAWEAQRGSGLRVRATGPAAVPGSVVVLTVGTPWLGYDVPCRVVWARVDGGERGFAYGTLPGHPLSGEEAFLVSLTPGGEVVLTLRAFSRPAGRLARLAGPATRAVQRLALGRYAAAVRRATASPGRGAGERYS